MHTYNLFIRFELVASIAVLSSVAATVVLFYLQIGIVECFSVHSTGTSPFRLSSSSLSSSSSSSSSSLLSRHIPHQQTRYQHLHQTFAATKANENTVNTLKRANNNDINNDINNDNDNMMMIVNEHERENKNDDPMSGININASVNANVNTCISSTLASSYVIRIHEQEHDDDQGPQGPLTWILTPLGLVEHGTNPNNGDGENGVGSLAIEGLKSSFDFDTFSDNHIRLICNSFVDVEQEHDENNNSDGTDDDNNNNDDDDDAKINVNVDVQIENINVNDNGNGNAEREKEEEEEGNIQNLIAVLSRVMVQQKVRSVLRDRRDTNTKTNTRTISEKSNSSSDIHVRISLPMTSETSETSETVSMNASDLLASSGCQSLYQSLLLLPSSSNNIEMSDMVDSSGKILGSVPRILIHKHNILHRGIGIVVCREEHITKVTTNRHNYHHSHPDSNPNSDSDQDTPDVDTKINFDPVVDIYCHRRTDTKRIFPSLYDMFVGGVSVSGESPELTAAREVAEELGLNRALRCIIGDGSSSSSSSSSNGGVIDKETSSANVIESNAHSNDQQLQHLEEDKSSLSLPSLSSPLSSPLFQCIICTSYNRCVVTVFTYQYKNDLDDEIKWQEEEVSWGDFVPYRIVQQAAVMSIDRLIQSHKWPGFRLGSGSNNDNDNNNEDGDGKDDDDDDVEMKILNESRVLVASSSLSNSDHECKDWDFVPDGLLVWMAWLNWRHTI